MTARPLRDFAELLMQRNAFKEQLRQNAAELRQAKRRRSASSQKDPMDDVRRSVLTSYVLSGFSLDVAVSTLDKLSEHPFVQSESDKKAFVEDLLLAASDEQLASCFAPRTTQEKAASALAAEAVAARDVSDMNSRGVAPSSQAVWDLYKKHLPDTIELKPYRQRSRYAWVQRFREKWHFRRGRLQRRAVLEESEMQQKAQIPVFCRLIYGRESGPIFRPSLASVVVEGPKAGPFFGSRIGVCFEAVSIRRQLRLVFSGNGTAFWSGLQTSLCSLSAWTRLQCLFSPKHHAAPFAARPIHTSL